MNPQQKMSIALIMAICWIPVISAQESDHTKQRPVQFTFIYPLGSNGTAAAQYSNNFSLNALIGVNGGVRGGEVGGLVNYNHGNVYGGQIGGIANINHMESLGAMVSGVVNYTGATSSGFMLSTINIAGAEMKGFQLGVLNFAGSLKGIQLGVINVAGKGEKAFPIGLINVVKNGHYEFEMTVSEMAAATLNYKMGVERLYTIFKTGTLRSCGETFYTAGFGFGSMINIHSKHNVVIDASISQLLNKHTWHKKESHFFAEMDLSYKFRLTEHFSLIAGPTYNLYGTNSHLNDASGCIEVPYSFHSQDTKKGQVSMWMGFTAGISFIL